jgi:outer membrane protein OmpU
MKKALFTSTAIAVVGLFSLAGAPAQASAPTAGEKLKINIGGFMIQTIGYAQQSGTSSGLSRKHVDQKSDSEIYFRGAVNLDNGLTVSLDAEMESDLGSSSQMDESYLTIGSADVGTLYMGATNAASFYLGVSAPWAGLNFFDGTLGNWIGAPTGYSAISTSGSTTYNGSFDYNRIEYISPSIAGFRVGGGYAPSTTASQVMPNASETDHTNASVQWAPGTLSGVKPRVYAGWWRSNGTHTSTTDTYSTGADVNIGDFIIGGGYATAIHRYDDFATTTNQPDGAAYNAGVKYAPGPFSVALTWSGGSAEATTAVAANDKFNRVALGADYLLGPGVKLVGDIIRIVYTDEADGGQAAENNGWAAITGLRVDF